MQPAREFFVCPCATRADLPIIRHTLVAGHRFVIHAETEGQVTLGRKRRRRRLDAQGVGEDSDRGGYEHHGACHLRADDERPDGAELYRRTGARDPLQAPVDGRPRGLQCGQQAD